MKTPVSWMEHVWHVGRIRRNAVIGHLRAAGGACIGRLRCANPPYVSPRMILVLLLAVAAQSHAAEQQHLATVQSPDKHLQYIF